MSLLKDNLARIVAIRERWIAINDDTVAPSLTKSIRRILPLPFLFEAIPFREHADALAQMMVQLEEEIALLERFRTSEFADAYHRNVASAAILYARAIRTAVSNLREIKKRMADSLDNVGPKYSWSDYNRDMARYDLLRPDVATTGGRLSEAINGTVQAFEAPPRTELPIEDAVAIFLNSVRQHVENNWSKCADQLADCIPNPREALREFVKSDAAKFLVVHAMFAIELREARRVYPVHLVQQIESLTLGTINANLDDGGEQLVAYVMRFLIDYDDAVKRDLPAMWGIGVALANYTQTGIRVQLPSQEFSEYSKFMVAATESLKLDWWPNFASRVKLEVGA